MCPNYGRSRLPDEVLPGDGRLGLKYESSRKIREVRQPYTGEAYHENRRGQALIPEGHQCPARYCGAVPSWHRRIMTQSVFVAIIARTGLKVEVIGQGQGVKSPANPPIMAA